MRGCVSYWHGQATGSWWALTRDTAGRYRLLEAADQAALGRALSELATPAPPPVATPMRQVAPTVPTPAEPDHRYHARHATGYGWRHTLGGLIAPGA